MNSKWSFGVCVFISKAAALVHIYKDGSVLVSHGGAEMGQGIHTKIQQVPLPDFCTDLQPFQIFWADLMFSHRWRVESWIFLLLWSTSLKPAHSVSRIPARLLRPLVLTPTEWLCRYIEQQIFKHQIRLDNIICWSWRIYVFCLFWRNH